MSRSSEIEDDYRIIDKKLDGELYYNIAKPDLNIEIIENNPYQLYDEYCDRMNRIKYGLLGKTNLAGMGEVVNSTEEFPIIGTQALDTCYGILFYDRKKKEGISGHAVPGQLIVVLAEMMKWLEGRTGNIEYMILPGFRNVDRHDYSGFLELNNYMLEHIPVGIKMISLKDIGGFRLHQGTLSYEFAFNTSTGEFVTEYVFFESIEHNPRYIGPKSRR